MSGPELVARLQALRASPDERRFAAAQLLMLHEAAMAHPGGTFLELGTDRGQATNVILAACAATGGRLVSVDVRDCSTAASSPHWTFVQASSIDREAILAAAPFLGDGVDFIYVDSLHTAEHVEKEVRTWFDLVRPNGDLFFDDIDSAPYLAGRRKNNAKMEIANRRIRELIEHLFQSNLDRTELALFLGSTGLARLRKLNGLGEGLAPPAPMPRHRRSELLAKVVGRLRGRRYVHRGDGSDFIWNRPGTPTPEGGRP